jgi:hypothetical protein
MSTFFCTGDSIGSSGFGDRYFYHFELPGAENGNSLKRYWFNNYYRIMLQSQLPDLHHSSTTMRLTKRNPTFTWR